MSVDRTNTITIPTPAPVRSSKSFNDQILEQLQQQAIASQLWAFYPTPPPLVAKMLSLAQLQPGMTLLEPQAGLGHICRQLRQLGIEPDCFEIAPLLRCGSAGGSGRRAPLGRYPAPPQPSASL